MNINKATLHLYWQHVRTYKLSFFVMLVATPLAFLLNDTLLPYLLSQAIGTFSTGSLDQLSHFLWLAVGVAIAGVSLNLLGFQAAIIHESSVRRDLANDIIARLLIKDQAFFASQKVGALTGKFIDFLNAHVGLQDLFIIRTLSFILSVGTGVIIIFMHTPLLGLIILGLIIMLLVQIRLSVKLRTPLRQARKQLVGEMNGAAADTISNSLTVKTFAREEYEINALSALTNRYKQVYTRDFRWMSVEGSARILLMSIVQIIAISILAHMLQSGAIGLGIAIFVVAYLQRVSGQLFALGDIINGYDRLLIQAAPMTEILMSDHTIKDTTTRTLSNVRGAITLQAVNYAYQDTPDINVLDNINLVIPKGQKVGLVGHSGAGKTTVSKLLLRFDDISSGSITIDDTDIRHVTQASLRDNIAYVPQEPMLFHRSLRENIAYGNPTATDSDIHRAITQANAYDFIQQLPDGLETVVGERGVKLSGGQRQRIAIARAIIKDAPILILDEATSALDSESEKLIQDSLESLMKGRTSIVIAHRLSTIAKLDRIIVLDNGKIVEDGSHDELLKNKSTYAKLWSHQSGGFIED
ncbi:MAG: ABC transporter ATP-binding protein [Candidatus Saccharimonadales bacterium]